MLGLHEQVQVRGTCYTCNGTGRLDVPEGADPVCHDCEGEGKKYRWVSLRDIYKLFSDEIGKEIRRRRPGLGV